MSHKARVVDFMRMVGQDTPGRLTLPDEKVRQLRARLIAEEAIETINALGFSLGFHEEVKSPNRKVTYMREVTKENFDVVSNGNRPDSPVDYLTNIADGCCDLYVVTTGTLLACGIDYDPVLKEVDLNNLEKFGEGSYRDPNTNKWVKPPNHQPPRIKDCILKQYDLHHWTP